MTTSSYLFTSESVSEGHPDKIADQISDAVLDAILAQDKRARVACETMVKTGAAIVAGEVTPNVRAFVKMRTGREYEHRAQAEAVLAELVDEGAIHREHPAIAILEQENDPIARRMNRPGYRTRY